MSIVFNSYTNDTNYFFNCSQVPTQHKTANLWKKPLEAAEVIREWESKLASLRSYGLAPSRYPWRRGNNNNSTKYPQYNHIGQRNFWCYVCRKINMVDIFSA